MKANLSWITDTIATGGDLSPDPTEALDQVEDIYHQGIDVVIDMRTEADDRVLWEEYPEITYVHVPSNDAIGYRMPQSVFDAVVNAAKSADRVLVHCHMGINRGPSGAFAVLLDAGIDPVVAFDWVRRARPIAGVAYARDALVADQRRRRLRGEVVRQADIARLDRHMKAVMTPEVMRSIQHKIRTLHEEDAANWARLAGIIRERRR